MSNDFEYQSNLMNDNIKSEPNEEEDTEDMSEDIDEEGDKRENVEVVNTEDKTQLVTKRNLKKVAEVPTDSGQTEKRKSSSMLMISERKNKRFKTAEGSKNSEQTCNQIVNQQQLPKVMITAPQTLAKQNGDKQAVPVVTASPQTPSLVTVLQCIVYGCSTLCWDQMTLNRHLELDHKIINSVLQTRLTPIEPKRVTPVAISTAKVISTPEVKTKAKVKPSTIASYFVKPESSYTTDIKHFINNRKEFKKKSVLKDTRLGSGCIIERQTKEVILNLNQFFKELYPNECQQTINQVIESATKVSAQSVRRTLIEFKTNGTLKEVIKTRKREPLKYKCNDEDRDVLSTVVYKLRDENKLTGYMSVYNTIRTSQEFNPTFKKCSLRTFAKLFTRFGFRICPNRIWDIKPSDLESERTACQRTKDSKSEKYVCEWPGCEKEFNNRNHLIFHLRTHTNVKPFACRYPKCDYRCAVSSNFTKHLKCHNKTEFPNEDIDESEPI